MKFIKKPLLISRRLYGDVCRYTTACRRASTSEPECTRENQLVASIGKHLKPVPVNHYSGIRAPLTRNASVVMPTAPRTGQHP